MSHKTHTIIWVQISYVSTSLCIEPALVTNSDQPCCIAHYIWKKKGCGCITQSQMLPRVTHVCTYMYVPTCMCTCLQYVPIQSDTCPSPLKPEHLDDVPLQSEVNALHTPSAIRWGCGWEGKEVRGCEHSYLLAGVHHKCMLHVYHILIQMTQILEQNKRHCWFTASIHSLLIHCLLV